MKRKLFGSIAAIIIVFGVLLFSVNQQNEGDTEGIKAQNIEALADMPSPCPDGPETNCYWYRQIGGCEVQHDCEVVCLGGC